MSVTIQSITNSECFLIWPLFTVTDLILCTTNKKTCVSLKKTKLLNYCKSYSEQILVLFYQPIIYMIKLLKLKKKLPYSNRINSFSLIIFYFNRRHIGSTLWIGNYQLYFLTCAVENKDESIQFFVIVVHISIMCTLYPVPLII